MFEELQEEEPVFLGKLVTIVQILELKVVLSLQKSVQGDVFDVEPLDLEASLEFVMHPPKPHVLGLFEAGTHLGHPEQLVFFNHSEKQEDFLSFLARLQIILVENGIVFGNRSPDTILHGLVYVVFSDCSNNYKDGVSQFLNVLELFVHFSQRRKS